MQVNTNNIAMDLDQLEEALEVSYTPSFVNTKPKKFAIKKQPAPPQNPPILLPPPPSPISNGKSNQFFDNASTLKDELVIPSRRQSMIKIHKSQSIENRSQDSVNQKKKIEKDEWSIPIPEIENYSFAKPKSEFDDRADTPHSLPSKRISQNQFNKSNQAVYNKKKQFQTISSQSNQARQPFGFNAKKETVEKGYGEGAMKASEQMIQTLKNQIQSQKEYYESKLEETIMKHKRQKQLLSEAERQAKFKLELKQMQIEKLKQFFQYQKNFKLKQQNSSESINKLVDKLQQKLESFEKMNIHEPAKTTDPKLAEKIAKDLDEIKSRQKQFETKTTDFELYQATTRKQLAEQKKVLLGEYKRLEELQNNLILKQKKLQSETILLKTKLYQENSTIKSQYEQKLKELELEKESANYQKQIATDLQNTYHSKYKQLLDNTHQKARQVNYQKLKVEQKSIQYNNLVKQVSMKNDQVEHLRVELKNKINLMETAYRKNKEPTLAMTTNSFYKQSTKERFYDVKQSEFLEDNDKFQNWPKEYSQSDFKQSLMSLKNEYLKSIQHIKGDRGKIGEH